MSGKSLNDSDLQNRRESFCATSHCKTASYCLVPQMLLPRATQAIHANAVKILENRADNRNTKHLPKPHRIIVEYYIEKPHCLAAAVSVLPINNNMPQLKTTYCIRYDHLFKPATACSTKNLMQLCPSPQTTYGQQQDRRDQQLPPLIIIGKNSAPAHQDESNGGHYA